MPLELPTQLISSVSRRLAEASTSNMSPFSGSEQVQDWGGAWWEYDISIAVQYGRDGRRLSAFFAQLGGKKGTFLMADPSIENPPLPARRNLLTYTQQIDNAAWVKQANVTITADAGAAPDGTITADQHAISAASGRLVSQTIAVSPLTTYTFSLDVRRVSGSGGFTLELFGNSSGSTTSVVALSDEWVRYTVTKTTDGSDTTLRAGWLPSTSGDEVLIWGAQLDPIATATAYQPIVAGTEFDGVTVNGAGQSGTSLNVTGLVGEPLLAGDFFQIGTGLDARLHQLTQDVVITDYAGTLNFVPALRSVPLDGAPVEVETPNVLLRMNDPVPTLVAPGDKFRFSFTAREAI